MNIKGLNKAEILPTLYNNAEYQGFGFLEEDGKQMTVEEAQKILDSTNDKYFDYLKGRKMKIKIEGDEIDTHYYNRCYGEGAAENLISKLNSIQSN